MKARVKATGEIVEISEDSSYVNAQHFEKAYYLDELEWIDVKKDNSPDYWTRLEHQYAGMFMKSFLDNFDGTTSMEILADDAIKLAHALVEKYKKDEK